MLNIDVKLKSIEEIKKTLNIHGEAETGLYFNAPEMEEFCGTFVKIKKPIFIGTDHRFLGYKVNENSYTWAVEWMDLVENLEFIKKEDFLV